MLKPSCRTGAALACAACLAMAAPPPLLAGTPPCDPANIREGGSDAQCPRAEPPRNRDDNDFAEAGAAILAAGVVAILVCAIVGCGGKSLPAAEELRRSGPRIGKKKYEIGRFPVTGFVRSNWPMVVEFESRPGSFTWVEIATADKRSAVVWLDTGGEGGLYQAKVTIPPAIEAGEPVPAMLLVRSAQARDGALLRDGGGDPLPSPLDVVAIGAGPGAIGSVAVNRLSFRQAGGQPGAAFAPFDFFAAKAFNRAVASIVRFRAKGNDVKEDVVRDYETGPLAERSGGRGTWDGFARSGKATRGVHRLQVRAWKDRNEDLSWVGAVSRDRVVLP